MRGKFVRSPLVHLLLAVVAGFLLANAHSLRPIDWLAWFAGVPLVCLAFLTSSSPKSALLYGMLAGLISSLSLFLYLAQLSNVPVAILLSVLRAGQYGLITWLVSLGFKHLHPGFLVFLYPALSAGLDFIITLLSPHGSGGSLAYSQMDFLPLVQTASFGGVIMITFVLSLFATLLALVLIYRKVGLLVVLAISIVLFLSGLLSPAMRKHPFV